MLINAAPRSYTSNIVADSDLNLEGYNVTANAIYSKDNYLLTMLDYGEAFPTDVKEGDKLFAWGEDSTKSYIYTYKQGAWDAGVKPHHMQDYYIADENRTVKFYFLKGDSSRLLTYFDFIPSGGSQTSLCRDGLIFSPDVYLMGSFYVWVGYTKVVSDVYSKIYALDLVFTDCTTSFNKRVRLFENEFVGYGYENQSLSSFVTIPSGLNAFVVNYIVAYAGSVSYSHYVKMGYVLDV